LNQAGKVFTLKIVANTKRDIWVCAFLAMLVIGAYWRVVGYEFVNLDDPAYILENPIVKQGFTAKGLKWAFGRIHGEATYWHPLTWVSHMLDVQLFGVNAGAHHLMNVFFHAVNAILIFLLFQQLTGAFWRSAAVAALFAVHPLQVDTVAWVTERKNLLSALFWTLTTMAYIRYARNRNWSSYGLTILLFALGLMCKPILVTLPCVLLLLDYWPLNRWPWGSAAAAGSTRVASPQRLVIEKIPLVVLSGISSWITIAAHEGLGMTQKIHGYSLGVRLENALVSYARYLGKIFWPSDLAIAYPYPGEWPAAKVYGSVALLLVITFVVVLNFRRKPYLAVGWCWFLGVLVPTIGIVQVGLQAMADRFAYVPVIGIFLMVVWGVADWAATQRSGELIARMVAGLAIAGCTVVTSFQLGHWKTSEMLFTHALKVTERNYVAHHSLAGVYVGQRRTNEAVFHAMEALRISPRAHEPLLILGLTSEWEQDLPRAISNYQRALSIDPEWPAARKALAYVFLKQGDLEAAYAEFLSLTKAAPSDPDGPSGLGEVHLQRHEPEAALAHFHKALELDPDSDGALNNIAWFLATYPDAHFRNGAEAVRHAERACQLTQRKVPFLLGTLAAAYAEAGRFPEAVRTAEEARALAIKEGNNQIAEANAKLLELYRANKPFHEGENPL
jgi:protein O-mannosyl-transferase